MLPTSNHPLKNQGQGIQPFKRMNTSSQSDISRVNDLSQPSRMRLLEIEPDIKNGIIFQLNEEFRNSIEPLQAELREIKDSLKPLETGTKESGDKELKERISALLKSLATTRERLQKAGSDRFNPAESFEPYLQSIGRQIEALNCRLGSVQARLHPSTLTEKSFFKSYLALEAKVRDLQKARSELHEDFSKKGKLASFDYPKEMPKLEADISRLKDDAAAWIRAKTRYSDLNHGEHALWENLSRDAPLVREGVIVHYNLVKQCLDGLSERLADLANTPSGESTTMPLLTLLTSHPTNMSMRRSSDHMKVLGQIEQMKPKEQAMLLAKVADRVLDPKAMEIVLKEVQRRLDCGWSMPMVWSLLGVAAKQYLGSFGVGTLLVKNTGYPEFLLVAAFLHKIMEGVHVDDRVGSFGQSGSGNRCVRWSRNFLTDSVPALLFLAALCLSDWWVDSRAESGQTTGWTKAEGARDLTIRLASGILGSSLSLLAVNGLRQATGGSFRYVHPSQRRADYTQVFKFFCDPRRICGGISRLLSIVPVAVCLRMGLVNDEPYWPDFVLIGGWMFRDTLSDFVDACCSR